MSDLVGNPEDRFSQNEAQIMTELAVEMWASEFSRYTKKHISTSVVESVLKDCQTDLRPGLRLQLPPQRCYAIFVMPRIILSIKATA